MSQGGALSSSGSGGNAVESVTGNSGGPVGPDAAFNIDLVGNNSTGIDVVGTPASNLLTIINTTDYVSDSGTANITSNDLNIVGAAGIATSAAGNTITIDGSGLAITFQTDSGSATPALNILNVNGIHGLNTAGSGNTVDVAIDNAITLGDLGVIPGGSNALTAQTGDIEIQVNNLKLPSTASALEGVIEVNGSPWLHSYNSTNASISNVFLGLGTGNFTTTGTNNFVLGGSSLDSVTSGGANLAIGRSVWRNLTSGSGNVGIGYVIGTGVTTQDYNTMIGYSAGGNLASAQITAIGAFAMNNFTTGTQNVAVGYRAMNGFTGGADGSGNTTVGYQAGQNFQSNDHNTAVGANAMSTTFSGEQNSALGSSSLFNNVSGSFNVAVGYQTLFSATSSNNTGLGRASLNSLTSGANNTGVGFNSLFSVVTGSDNIGLGYLAGDQLTTNDSNNILIGNRGVAGDNATIKIGTSGTHTTAFIHGVASVSVSNTEMVTIDTTTGQLGSQALPDKFFTVTALDNTDSPYTALSSDYYFSCDVSSGVLTIELPNAPATGRVYIVKDSGGDAATNNITVTTVGGVVNIDGATTFVMNTNYEAANFLFSGSSWEVF